MREMNVAESRNDRTARNRDFRAALVSGLTELHEAESIVGEERGMSCHPDFRAGAKMPSNFPFRRGGHDDAGGAERVVELRVDADAAADVRREGGAPGKQ